MSQKTIQIAKRFPTVLEAVNHAVSQGTLDIEYNPKAAIQKAKETDHKKGSWGAREAFISAEGDVYYVYQCDIPILHKFDPFVTCLDDSSFDLATIGETEVEFLGVKVPKTKIGRKSIAFLARTEPKILAA